MRFGCKAGATGRKRPVSSGLNWGDATPVLGWFDDGEGADNGYVGIGIGIGADLTLGTS